MVSVKIRQFLVKSVNFGWAEHQIMWKTVGMSWIFLWIRFILQPFLQKSVLIWNIWDYLKAMISRIFCRICRPRNPDLRSFCQTKNIEGPNGTHFIQLWFLKHFLPLQIFSVLCDLVSLHQNSPRFHRKFTPKPSL